MARTKGTPRDSSEAKKIKKEKSREKEYRRSQNINTAFDFLQQHIPYLKPEERKNLPKIKTLRLAMQYISHLNKLLDGTVMAETECNETRPLLPSDFRTTVINEMRIRNSYRERAHTQEMDQETVQRILHREENRRRCVPTVSDDSRGFYPPQYSRQFGPISGNVYNFRQIQVNNFGPPYMALPNPMMMAPYNQMPNMENQFAFHQIPMDPYMTDSGYSS